eukprot:UN07712
MQPTDTHTPTRTISHSSLLAADKSSLFPVPMEHPYSIDTEEQVHDLERNNFPIHNKHNSFMSSNMRKWTGHVTEESDCDAVTSENTDSDDTYYSNSPARFDERNISRRLSGKNRRLSSKPESSRNVSKESYMRGFFHVKIGDSGETEDRTAPLDKLWCKSRVLLDPASLCDISDTRIPSVHPSLILY